MAELLIPADEEPAVVDELNDRMSIKWATRLPGTRPKEFGRVVATGGAQRDLVTDEPRVTLEGFAQSETRARRIVAEAIGHLQAAGRDGVVGDVTCYGVTVVGLPANVPLPSVNDRYRFIATVSVSLRRDTV